jgi:hypothetical protein
VVADAIPGLTSIAAVVAPTDADAIALMQQFGDEGYGACIADGLSQPNPNVGVAAADCTAADTDVLALAGGDATVWDYECVSEINGVSGQREIGWWSFVRVGRVILSTICPQLYLTDEECAAIVNDAVSRTAAAQSLSVPEAQS